MCVRVVVKRKKIKVCVVRKVKWGRKKLWA
jgi:hypothetical protein